LNFGAALFSFLSLLLLGDSLWSSGLAASRTVVFSEKIADSPGTLMLVPAVKTAGNGASATLIGPALGRVEVPEGKELFLVVSPEGASRLACLRLLKAGDLRRLRLHDVPVSESVLNNVVLLPGLEDLDLSKTDLSDRDLAVLSKIGTLKKLDLSGTLLHGSGLKRLAALKNLIDLDVDSNRLGNDSISVLTSALPALQILDLSSTSITDAGVALLPRLKHLTKLRLNHCDITDRCMVDLAKIKTLEKVNLTGTEASPDGLRRLQAALPALHIEWKDKRRKRHRP